MEPQHLTAALTQVRDGGPGAAEAREALIAAGPDVVPAVIAAIGVTQGRLSFSLALPELVANPRSELGSLLRLVRLLIALDDPSSVSLLLRLLHELNVPLLHTEVYEYLSRLFSTLEQRATDDDIALLIRALDYAHRRAPLAGLSVQLGARLIRIAQRDPNPALYAALPLLKPALGKPFPFVPLHRQLKALLNAATLPVPAQPQLPTDTLPIPAEKAERDGDA